MQFDRDQIAAFLRDHGRRAEIAQALRQLPPVVDTEAHGGLLAQLGISGQMLIDAATAGPADPGRAGDADPTSRS